MNLTELFEVQRELDAEIEKKHPTFPGEDRLSKRILALQVELGECANEWRGFKFWSTNQSPRNLRSKCPTEKADYFFCGVGHEEYSVAEINNHGDYCYKHSTVLMPMRKRNPLLEEYVDCLHFILSIGIETEREENLEYYKDHKRKEVSITKQFILVSTFTIGMADDDYFTDLLYSFIYLGEMLGFTWEQVTEAYMSKNQINWQRQESGY